jgi:hypothetical protein
MLLRVIIDFVVDYLKCNQPSLIASCYGFFGLTLEEKVGYTLQCYVRDSKGEQKKRKQKFTHILGNAEGSSCKVIYE